MKVIKRSGKEVNYDRSKIENAIINANNSVDDKRYQLKPSQITKITDNVILECEKLGRAVHVEEIQDVIERKLMEFGKFTLAKKYILYRDKHALIRQANSTDESIMTLVRNANKDAMEENSNKNAIVA